jgi:hypothetical protein
MYRYAEVARLRFWGVVPPGAYNPNTELTYGEFVQYLKKLMACDKQNLAKWGAGQGFYKPRAAFTDDIIKKFGFGAGAALPAYAISGNNYVNCAMWRHC